MNQTVRSFFFLFVCLLISSLLLAQTAPSIIWQKTLGGTGFEICFHIEITSDKGSVVIGTTTSTDGDVAGSKGSGATWVVKLDSLGNIQWKSLFNGIGQSIKQTTDKGYILTGSYPIQLGSHSSTSDCWLARIDSAGNLQWEKQLGGSGGDGGASVIQTSDGNFLVCGNTNSTDGDVSGVHTNIYSGILSDCWLVKVDGSGNIIWQKCLGGSLTDFAESITQTSDGGFLMTATTYSNDGDVSGHHNYINAYVTNEDGWAVKLDSAANIQWQKCLGGSLNEALRDGKQTINGNYIVAAFTQSNDGDVTDARGQDDYWLIQLDNTGNIQWQKTYGGTGFDYPQSIEITSDGGYLVSGSSNSIDGDVKGAHIPAGSGFVGNEDYWVIKTDSTGVLQWEKALGGTGFDYAANAKQLSDNSYVVAGSTYSNDGDVTGYHTSINQNTTSDYWIVKLDTGSRVLPITFVSFSGKENGNQNILQWIVENHQTTGNFEIQRSTDGKTFLSIGSLAYSAQTNFSFIDENIVADYYYRIKQTEKDGISKYTAIIYIARNLSPLVCTVYPNPAKDIISVNIVSLDTRLVKLSVTSLTGSVLLTKSITISNGKTTVPLTISQLSRGSYFIKLTCEKDPKTHVIRFLKE